MGGVINRRPYEENKKMVGGQKFTPSKQRPFAMKFENNVW